eukprot:TRINITY_DN7930_c0_g1_i3.p1 TRINITY_DN7930_c0_g1~~TRINITY_DN7930_c0_g1_i3.p1  ORF type:complete len:1271 (-),score=149.20 TRINITY_DN7930_c0_g1_i3:216-3584(-)
MRSDPTMDGVIGVTQCGLRRGQSMTYTFIVQDEPGTYWYHGHGAAARGIAGPLIVHAPPGEEVHAGLYDREKLLFVGDWAHEAPAPQYQASQAGWPARTSVLINGWGGEDGGVYSVVNVVKGGSTRIRICNIGENFPLRISIDFHNMTVIATDGLDTEPLTVDALVLHLGERYDVIVTADQNTSDGNFWIRAQSLDGDSEAQIVTEHGALGILRYNADATASDGASQTDRRPSVNLPSSSDNLVPRAVGNTFEYLRRGSGEITRILNCFDARPSSDGALPGCLPVTALVTHKKWRPYFDELAIQDPDEHHEVAFGFAGGAQYARFTRVSPHLHQESEPSREGHRLPGPNGEVYTQFVMPGKPTLYHGKEGAHNHSVMLDITNGAKVQIAWNHEGRGAHPIHLHGYKFVVAAIHEAPKERCSLADCRETEDWFAWPANADRISAAVRAGRYVVKDTAVLPFGGYVVVRFKANNPGHWLAHCHTDRHLADGMGVLIRDAPAGEHDARFPMPTGFPSCAGADFEALDAGYRNLKSRPACECLAPMDTPTLRSAPSADYHWRCSTGPTCRHSAVGQTLAEQKVGARGLSRSNWMKPYVSDDAERAERLWQNVATIVVSIAYALGLYLCTWFQPREPRESMHPWLKLFMSVLVEEYPKRINGLNLFMTCGLAIVAGCIYYDSGMRDVSDQQVGEQISLVFWQCAFWSVSTVYGSVVSYQSKRWMPFRGLLVHVGTLEDSHEIEMHMTKSLSSETKPTCVVPVEPPNGVEDLRNDDEREPRRAWNWSEATEGGLPIIVCRIDQYHVVRFLINFTLSPWPILYALIIDGFAGISPSFSVTLLVGVILTLNAQVFESMGRMLAELAGTSRLAVGVAFASILSQTFVIAGGFYKHVTVPMFAWITHVNGIKYGFTAIARLYFPYTRSVWVMPDAAQPDRGYTWSSLETMGAFTTLLTRGVRVNDSLDPPGVVFPILMLVVLIVAFRFLCFVIALIKAMLSAMDAFTRTDCIDSNNSEAIASGDSATQRRPSITSVISATSTQARKSVSSAASFTHDWMTNTESPTLERMKSMESFTHDFMMNKESQYRTSRSSLDSGSQSAPHNNGGIDMLFADHARRVSHMQQNMSSWIV